MTIRLTVAQALVRFLEQQYVERDGVENAVLRRLLGHLRPRQRRRRRPGAARARASRQRRRGEHDAALLPGPQRAGHGARRRSATPGTATGWRRSPCTASVGPGATNMVTGAALATDQPASRSCCCPATSSPPGSPTRCCRSSRTRRSLRRQRQRRVQAGLAVLGPDQPARAAAARRCSPRCGCSPTRPRPARSRSALPQDVQAEAYDWPRTTCSPSGCGTSPGPRSRTAALARAVEVIRAARAAADRRRRRRHLLAAPPRRCARSPRRPASRSRRPRRARARCPTTTRSRSGAIGATGTTAANALASEADVVIGVGTRYSDFTTASRTVFADPGRAVRQPQRRLVRRPQAVGRRRSWPTPAAGSSSSTEALAGWSVDRRAHRAGRPSSPASGTRSCSARTTSATRRCRRSRR